MANIGNLSFGIGGDDKQLREILDARKKDALELQKIFSSFNLGGKSPISQISDNVKKQEKLNRLEQSNLRLQETRERVAVNSLISQQRVNQAAERTRGIQLQNLRIDNERIVSEQRIRTEAERTEAVRRRSAADLARIDQERVSRERLNNQRILTEIHRTEAARQRAALVGVQGQNSLSNAVGLTNRTFFNQRALLSQLSSQLGLYFSIYQVGSFVKELAMVSGEFEKQRLSLAAILQNKMAADKLFGQIKDLAVISPFNFKELTSYAKQLSAFSIPTNELYDTMKRLADVSAGLGVDMNRIILAYGQVRSASVLRGQELRQFTEAGIPLVDELATKFSKLEGKVVSAGEVFDKISEREVPFAMIKEIMEDLTSEGGKFFNMQEIQAASLAGMITNLRDAYDIMLDSIGSANSELLKGSVRGITEVMENWQTYWGILKSIIIGYGVYKAAIIAATIANQGLFRTIQSLTVVQTIFNSLSKINPYALAIAGIAALIGGLVSFINHQNESKEKLLETITVINNHTESVNELINKLKELTKANDKGKSAEAERAAIISELAKKEPELAKSIKDHADNLEELVKVQERYNTLMDAKKFAKYVINESDGFLKDGIIDNLKDRAKAQNEADLSATALETTYTKFIETWKEVKKIGGFDTVLGKISITPQRISEIDTILASEKNHAEKILEIYKLVSYAENSRYRTKHKEGELGDSNILGRMFDDGHKDKVKEYSSNLFELSNITKQTNSDLDDLAEKLKVYLSNNGIDVFKVSEQDEVRAFIKSLEELGTYGQKEILTKWNIDFNVNGEEKNLDGWRQELKLILGSVITINADSNFNEVVKEMKEKYKEVKTRMEENKPILLRAKFDFEKMEFPYPANPSLLQLKEQYNTDNKSKGSLEAGGKLLGMTATDLAPKSKNGSTKDKVVEKLKEQVDLIKSAKKQYEELQKVMSKEDAFNKLISVPEYANIKQENITDEGYVKYINDQLKTIKDRNTEAAKDIRVTWNKELGEFQIKVITEDAQKEIAKVEKALSQHKEKYDQYKQLFEITGDKGQAAQLVFGDASASVTSYIDAMKNQLKGMSGGGIYEELLKVDPKNLIEPVRKVVEDISEAIREQDFTLKVDMAKIIADYATTEEKIAVIHNQYEAKREEARKSGASQNEIDKAVSSYDKAEGEAVAKLQEELWQLTPFYRQLFGDLSDISYRHLKKMVTDAKEAVTQIASVKVDPNDENSRLKYGKYNDRNGKLEGYYMPNEDGSVSKTLISLKQYEHIITKIASIQKGMRKDNPFDSLMRPMEDYKIAEGTEDEKQMPFIDVMASKAQDVNSIVQDIGGSLSGMFDALGNESAADATAFIGEMVGAASNVAMGIASGNPIQVIQGIVGGITAIAKNHDKKLDRAIEKSKIKVKELEGAYSELERFLERQLGAATQSQARQQLKNLEQQKKEVQSQLQNERDKKKSDAGAIIDYQNQINELNDKIRYFYEDLAGEQYGIKIKDWAKNISDALVEAWSKGEDAAEAFDKTVADIMKSVFKNILQLQYIEPAMQKLRVFLFGNDGKGGILGDGVMSQSDMSGLVKELGSLKKSVGDWEKAWDYLVEAAKQAGIDLENLDDSEKDSLSKGIESVTEDTASLLASYINAMRADLSMQLSFVGRILAYTENNTNYFALMQADIMLIQMNTLRTANNTDRLVELSEDTYSILHSASIRGSGIKFNIN